MLRFVVKKENYLFAFMIKYAATEKINNPISNVNTSPAVMLSKAVFESKILK